MAKRETTPQPWLAASSDVTRPVLMNVLLEPSAGDPDRFDVTATDGWILAHCPGYLMAPGLERKAWLVNAKAFGAVMKSAGFFPPCVELAPGVTRLYHENGKGRVSVDLVENGGEHGPFPAWRSVVPTGEPTDSPALLNPYLYARLAKTLGIGEDHPVFDCETYGATKAVKVTTRAGEAWGIIMPSRGAAAERELLAKKADLAA